MTGIRHGWMLAGILLTLAGPATAQTEWRVSAEPTLVIGMADGPIPYVFDDLRGAIVTADGRIAVADGRSREIRIFAPDGELVTTFGQGGEGPREFGTITWVGTCGGASLVVYDLRRNRITKWRPDGTFIDGFAVEGPDADTQPYSVSCGPDGSFAVVGWPDVRAFPAGRTGPYRLPVRIAVADSLGRRTRVVGTFPGMERYRYRTNDGPRFLGRSTTASMGSLGLYVGTTDTYRIELVAPDGSRSSFGDGRPGAPLTREIRDRWTADYLRDIPSERRPDFRRTLSTPDLLPDSLPAYAGFQLDRDGFLWVEPFRVPDGDEEELLRWEVFAPDGREVAFVVLPAGFRPTDIGADYLLGVARDALGVERVYRYGLERHGGLVQGAAEGEGRLIPVMLTEGSGTPVRSGPPYGLVEPPNGEGIAWVADSSFRTDIDDNPGISIVRCSLAVPPIPSHSAPLRHERRGGWS